mgnify:FL=1
MKENGGVIMVNFGSTFLDSRVGRYNDSLRNVLQEILINKGIKDGTDDAKIVRDSFQRSNPRLFSDVGMVADHIDHIVRIAGVNHVGFGSDYDGVGDSLPTGLKDVGDYPNLIAVLLTRGYSKSDIKKMCSGNLFRVWNKILKVAKNDSKLK